ncbi:MULTISPECIES: HK97 gp10 family phage protein [Actinomadura]|uniref:HK97 gp10 family phage protein n=1 Tax=Actinomadura yumaensis TaxID=111807 RepID=A0ABW2CU18_9ACTN|nr:HK97 gp10 family phage protein [Actinomadura sp. J1-007]MWK39574.1 hypothetical protein [Actinomadura sp. J1-007]
MATARIRYVPDFAGVRRIMTGPQMAELMRRRAETGASAAQARAPRDSGDYAAAFRVEVTRRGGPSRDRAEARLINTAAYARDVERRHHVLGQVVDDIERG